MTAVLRALAALAVLYLAGIGLALAFGESGETPRGLWTALTGQDGKAPIVPMVAIGLLLTGGALAGLDRGGQVARALSQPAPPRPFGAPEILALALCLLGIGAVLAHTVGLPTYARDISYEITEVIYRPVRDFFHEGERAAGLPILRSDQDLPLLIHGPGRNLLPAALAARFAPPDAAFAAMRFYEAAMLCATAVVLTCSAGLLSEALLRPQVPGRSRLVAAAALAGVALLFALIVGNITNRHTAPLLALGLCAAILGRARSDPRTAAWIAGGLGGLLVLAPLHVYAGAAEAALITLAAVALAALHAPRALPRIALTGTAGAAVAMAAIFLAGGLPLFTKALADMLYWVAQTGDLWSQPARADVETGLRNLTLMLAGMLALAIGMWRSGDPGRRDQAVVLGLVILGCLVALRNSAERSDEVHFGYTLLTVGLALAAVLAPVLGALAARWRAAIPLTAGVTAGLCVLVGPIWATGPRADQTWSVRHLPDDILLPDEVQAFARALAPELAGARCLMSLTNEGILNYAVDLPPCGPALYPVYLDDRGDAAFADWLAANPQPLVVTATPGPSDTIDGRPMADRLARTFAIITRDYPVLDDVAGWEIRRPAP